MKKIITLFAFSFLATSQVAADSNGSLNSGLKLNDNSALDLLGEYDLGYSLKGRYQIGGSISHSPDSIKSPTTRKAWVGIGGGLGEVRAGYHDSLDSLATISADQHKLDGAYDLIMRGDDSVQRSITYMHKAGVIGLAAQYGMGDSGDASQSMGVLLSTQKGAYETAIAYQRTPESRKAVKGRVTYKSRNNSKVRLDLVAEKIEAGDAPEGEIKADSMSFMVGAKYKLTPKAYVVGQYGIIDFDSKNNELADGGSPFLGRDYKALSLEAGYSLNGSASVFVSHSQKSDGSKLVLPLFGSDAATQTNSIGVRLNW